jgi:hypothetical protein
MIEKSKTAKFFICENPIADLSDGRLFILYNGKTKIFAEVFHFDANDEEAQMRLKSSIEIGATLEYKDEYIVFAALWVLPGKDLVNKNPQQQADLLAGIMRRMADWYEAYLIWEDKQDF